MDRYEEELTQLLTNEDLKKFTKPKTKLEKRVVRELIFKYDHLLTADFKRFLIDAIGRDKLKNKVHKHLKSRNKWRKKTGAYLTAKYNLQEFVPNLIEQLKVDDNEVLYVTAKSLIKLTGKTHLPQIFYITGKRKKLDKRHMQLLLENTEDNIKSFLDDVLESGKLFFKIVALEEYGIRQYAGCSEWILKMIEYPEKEMRIAALKASEALGDLGDESFLNQLLKLKNDEAWEVRAFLMRYLRNVNDPVSLDVLKDCMTDSNWYVRYNAANGLLSHGDAGVRKLKDLLNAEDAFARDAARGLLEKEGLLEL